MMSEDAHFIKDLIGPLGSVSMVQGTRKKDGTSSDIDGHTRASTLRVHYSERDEKGLFRRKDEWLDMSGEPSHQDLCDREQAFFLKTILEDLDLTDHHASAVNSLRIVLAADQSWRTGNVVAI